MYIGARHSYINFIRSQNNPEGNNPAGFCHIHSGSNYNLNKKWLDEIITKNKYKIGFTYVTENKRFSEYLMSDFYDDEEWIIPLNKRHYNCSTNVKINPMMGFDIIPGSILFTGKDHTSYEYIENTLLKEGIIPPMSFYLKWYYDDNVLSK